MDYFSKKFVPFKRLLEIKNTNRMYMFNYMELWILGCYKNYNERLVVASSSKDVKIINKWWKGCLKKFNDEKYVN
jgi:hypothetical protein